MIIWMAKRRSCFKRSLIARGSSHKESQLHISFEERERERELDYLLCIACEEAVIPLMMLCLVIDIIAYVVCISLHDVVVAKLFLLLLSLRTSWDP